MGGTLIAVQTALQLLAQAQAYMAVVAKARSEGREVSDAELDGLAAADDSARSALDQKIATAKSEGR
jgi:hypothetical protein